MRIAVISDIHGDLDSLRQVLTAIDRAATEQIWCYDATHAGCPTGFNNPQTSGLASRTSPWSLECIHRRCVGK